MQVRPGRARCPVQIGQSLTHRPGQCPGQLALFLLHVQGGQPAGGGDHAQDPQRRPDPQRRRHRGDRDMADQLVPSAHVRPGGLVIHRLPRQPGQRRGIDPQHHPQPLPPLRTISGTACGWFRGRADWAGRPVPLPRFRNGDLPVQCPPGAECRPLPDGRCCGPHLEPDSGNGDAVLSAGTWSRYAPEVTCGHHLAEPRGNARQLNRRAHQYDGPTTRRGRPGRAALHRAALFCPAARTACHGSVRLMPG